MALPSGERIMNFCSNCGSALESFVPDGDNVLRKGCLSCGFIHYINPTILVACVVHADDRVMWIKRRTEPRINTWSLPSGFMELGETLQEGALRELYEETGLKASPRELRLYSVGTIEAINQVHVHFRLPYKGQDFLRETAEASEVRFLKYEELHGRELAYPVLNLSSQTFYQEMKASKYGVHIGRIKSSGDIEVSQAGLSIDAPMKVFSSNRLHEFR
ncbi:NUDIX hydrolase [Parahaliea mediterranea]|uniref:NUDIX hydrolase n=1 Tax=Parahaliea mediterranea TaxID=651086 RepID=A0A939IKN2_9GAMM|nr:NUDIX hydrolase [Parahaliea mediterranea]MBN7797506.1 NUDIX hydrolase [Parahaliea mediterranea]